MSCVKKNEKKELQMQKMTRNLVDYEYYHVTTRGNKEKSNIP